jgi:uncharacterized protein YjiS (DUF1127 family)
MREYVLTQAEQQGVSTGLFATVGKWLRNRKNRRDLRKLLALEDHLLKDVGLSRGLIQHLATLPADVDAQREAERLQSLR